MKAKNLPIPSNEKERLDALLSYNILDTFSEEEFDNITQLASYICQVPIALISFIDKDRQWFKSNIGLDMTETSRDISFCQYAIMDTKVFEVPNTLNDENFEDNPLVVGDSNIRFYAGAPITTPEGLNIGTLCVLDNKPNVLNFEQKKALSTLAKSVMIQLELRNRNAILKSEVEKLAKKSIETITLELNSYKLALDETSCIVITDGNGIINFVNDATCEITKYSKAELIGQSNRLLNSGFHSKEFFSSLWKTITSGLIWKNEFKNRAKDNTFYWLDTTIVPFLDENGKPLRYVAISRNITKQKQKENTIEQFFNLSMDYLCVANVAGFFETISPTFTKELGYTIEELLTKPFYDFIHEDDVATTQNEIAKLAQGATSINFETRVVCKNGDYKLLSWNASPELETGLLYAIARDITVSKKNNEENRRLSLVAKGTDNIILITDKNQLIEWVNQPFETLTGYTFDEVIGKKPSHLLQYEKTDKNTVLQIREAIRNQTSFKGEIRNRGKNGNEYWLSISISPVFNDNQELIKFIAIESDITDKKKKDISIANLMDAQNAIFNGVGHAVIFNDEKGIIKRINKTGLELLGYTEEEILEDNLLVLHDVEEINNRAKELTIELGRKIEPNFEIFIAKTKEENNIDANEWTYISKSGRRIPVWVSVTCIKNRKGIILGYISVAEDYTVKKQVELDLINAKNIAELAVKAKDTFLANMSHEIRTPLNAIIGFTELITQSKLDETQTEYVNNIQVAGDNLLLIINDILDLSKIDSGQLVIESYPFNLKSTLKHVYDLLKVKATKNNLDFGLYLDAEMPEFVVGDKGRLNQIIMNLAGNAVKFTEEGEVTISVKKIKETDKTVLLRFSVKDTGIGITEEKLNLIFERFTQAEASTTRKFGGTGLGLNIVKQLVELQNGQIEVKSKLGRGSEFYFSLEYEKIDSTTVETITEVDLNAKVMGKLSILLCEDNELNQRLAKSVIQKFGFELDIANNGQEGIDLLIKNKYDLILMDLQMPVKDGYQTTTYIRNELKLDIPIIAMTAHSLVGEQQKCFDMGMNAYVAKPFKQNDLLTKIHSVVEKVAEKQIKLPSIFEAQELSKHSSKSKSIDWSYLDLSGDEEFKAEMTELFIKKVPVDLDLLEKAINEKRYSDIKIIAHDMKSSLSMFCLETEIRFLEKLEKAAIQSVMNEELSNEYSNLRYEVLDLVDLLKAY